jgi:predicted Zn-dependent peptidase
MLYYGAKCSEENSEKALKLLYEKFLEIKSPDGKKLQLIKKHLLQDYKKSLEYSSFVNNIIGNSIIDGTFESIDEYEKVLNDITQEDINDFIKKYFDLNKVAITVVHPETTPEVINANFAKAHNLNFKGAKTPLKVEKISEKVLDNNYKIGFYETDNDQIWCTTQLTYNSKHKINPAVCEVLNNIFEMGSLNYTDEEFDKIKEEYNMELVADITPRKMIISSYSNKEDFDKIMEIKKDILYNPRITEETLEKAKADIRDSIERTRDSADSLYIRHKSKTNPFCVSKNEILEKLDSVTIEDVKQLHQYVLENAKASVAINIPSNDSEFKENVINKFNSFEKVKPFNYDKIEIYKPNKQVEVLIQSNNASQADIAQFFNFEYNDTLEEEAMLNIMNTILTSSSIGLFSNLREKEQLAYSVYSDVNYLGDSAEISCHILTTTDNKAIGEISYDNVQKSINGFNRQIKALLNSEYTDDDLESAKRLLKASLINKEGNIAKVSSIAQAIQSEKGLDRENQLFKAIDNITREKLDEFSQKAFKNPPTYSIVASKDTLDANQEFFEALKQTA